MITRQFISGAYTYKTYRDLLDQLMEEGKTTGPNQSEDMVHYGKMNIQRMRRLDKTINVLPELPHLVEKLNFSLNWLIITEGWCGDAAQNIPVLEKIAAYSPHIQTRYVLRDENLSLMDAYLTNGGRSIPKLICLKSENLEELGTWGPRPKQVQVLVDDFKKKGVNYTEYAAEVQKWYTKDAGLSLQQEVLTLLNQWVS